MKRIKRINSHAGRGRFLAETGDEPIGYIPRQTAIPSPYAYSPTHAISDWNGKRVFIVETSHRYYDVFEVSAATEIYQTDEAATDAYISAKR